ncbi:MAG: DUF72 domain-containing protein [Verrucomicrobiae bacterium]|nr:DUF72 domain-containing protein [Verrucomicrobiae bacterium]
MARKQLLVGTAGWSYPDWEGTVYPQRCSGSVKLRTVAEFLDCVEVDSSFYRPPSARVVANWVKIAEPFPQFRFLAKAWQRFTHQRDSAWSAAEQRQFTDGLMPLREAGRLDALLFQFPWSFLRQPDNIDWLKRIAESFAGWPVAVELRHASWAVPGTAELFRRLGLIYCNVDQPALKGCLGPTAVVTSSVAYFRLHGRNAQNWFGDETAPGSRYDYFYSESELDELLSRMRRAIALAERTFAVFNNHRDAKAFANALQLKLRAEPESTVEAPAALLARFPSLCELIVPRADDQLSLL